MSQTPCSALDRRSLTTPKSDLIGAFVSQHVTTPNPRRRSRMVFLCLSMCLVAFALPALGRARAEPLPCGILITIPKPPPVPFPSPKPAPVPAGDISGHVSGSSLGAEIVLYRCQGCLLYTSRCV